MLNIKKHISSLKKLSQEYLSKNVLLIFLFLFSCTNLPKPLQEHPAIRDVPFKAVQESPIQYIDTSLLWGGRITNCTNTQDGTVFEILYLPLNKEGYPEEVDNSEGRFIVVSKNFLDCAVYSKGRLFTVVGKFKGLKEGRIDTMPYNFPVIEARATYLWKKRYKEYYWHPYLWFWYGYPPWYFEYGPIWR